jgi:NADPH-dependent 2,4-dienoyl-CoA reductase/sulfur reductase-like enzyme
MKVCIVGAGDSGATAAIQIRRLDNNAQIDMFSARASLGCPPCEMPLVIGGVVATWDKLVRGFRQTSFWEKRNVTLHLNTRVTDIDREKKYIVTSHKKYSYDKLILALGAVPVVPSFPGLDGRNEFTLTTDMVDGITLGNAVSQHTEAAIIGGGFIGLEIAAALKARGYSKVYLLVRHEILRAYLDEGMTEMVKELLRQNEVELIQLARIENISSKGDRKVVRLSDCELGVDFVFFATGAKPNIELAQKAGLEIGETGAIAVNEYL